MGAGKSTIGRLVAKGLSLSFYDSDREIESHTGASISLIFDVEGEDGFRKRETAVLEELTAIPHVLIATGGGAILEEENRRMLRSRGTVVYLNASIEQQLERTRWDKSRPLLQCDDPEQTLRDLKETRDPLYKEVADFEVETDKRRPKTVADEIVAHLS